MKIPLKKYHGYKSARNLIHWTSSKPFINNERSSLIHRPKYVITYPLNDGGYYLLIGHLCGGTVGGPKDITFLDEAPEWKMLCTRCEAKAINNGLPSADQLSGKHIHRGGMNTIFCDVC